jgi:hypothetical protein
LRPRVDPKQSVAGGDAARDDGSDDRALQHFVAPEK